PPGRARGKGRPAPRRSPGPPRKARARERARPDVRVERLASRGDGDRRRHPRRKTALDRGDVRGEHRAAVALAQRGPAHAFTSAGTASASSSDTGYGAFVNGVPPPPVA